MILRCRQHTFVFPCETLVMGIVNVTPDSFSDGGHFHEPAAAVARARQLVGEGADLIDLGGESTRPQATPVSEEEELKRVLPVIQELAGNLKVPLSIDTMKPGVARACLKAGASLVNDVGAGRRDPEMWRAVAELGAGYVLMHSQGTPQTMQQNPVYQDVVKEVGDFFKQGLGQLSSFGISPEQIILDVGLGFGKTLEHNMLLLGGLHAFKKLGRPMLLGASRKSFIGKLTGAVEPAARLPGSLACACWAIGHGVGIIRTHDVAATRQALRMMEAILARKKSDTGTVA